YDTVQKKIRFMSSRFKDTALMWYMGLIQRNAQAYVALKNAERAAMIPALPPMIVQSHLAFDFDQYPPVIDPLTTWEGFTSHFKSHFGDPNARATAEHTLETLRQVTSVAEYASKYQTHCYELDDTEQCRANGFYKHLKPGVKDEIMRLGKPDNLPAMISMAIDIDTRVMERVSERKLESSSALAAPAPQTMLPPSFASITYPSSHQPPVNTNSGPVPMQVDAIQASTAPSASRPRGPLTPSKRQRRMDLNLCLYCGMPNHRAGQCPNRPSSSRRPPSHFAQTSSATAYTTYDPHQYHQVVMPQDAFPATTTAYSGNPSPASNDASEQGKALPQQ
ncbi:hypothetical protein A4X03_0g7523, partial [Tilletia caries]